MEGQKKVAVVSARGLGDALLTMTLAHNLVSDGRSVVFYSSVLSGLGDYFPEVEVLPFVENAQNIAQIVEQNAVCIFADRMICAAGTVALKEHVFILDRKVQSREVPYAESFAQQLRTFGLNVPLRTWRNGLKVPRNYGLREFPSRVVLHPTSTNIKKDWPMGKFIRLAQRLIESGLQPVFILTKGETTYQEAAKASGIPYVCLSLQELVPFLYESGGMVANDSGPGHLAAFTGIPVISIFSKAAKSRMWVPSGPNITVVVPPVRLWGKSGSRFWKSLLSVRRVERALAQALSSLP